MHAELGRGSLTPISATHLSRPSHPVG